MAYKGPEVETRWDARVGRCTGGIRHTSNNNYPCTEHVLATSVGTNYLAFYERCGYLALKIDYSHGVCTARQSGCGENISSYEMRPNALIGSKINAKCVLNLS